MNEDSQRRGVPGSLRSSQANGASGEPVGRPLRASMDNDAFRYYDGETGTFRGTDGGAGPARVPGASPAGAPVRQAQTSAKPARPAQSDASGAPVKTQSANNTNSARNKKRTPKKAESEDAKRDRRKSRYKRVLSTVIVLLLVILASSAISSVIISCVDDVLAIGRSKDKITVSVTEGMTTEQVIGMLCDKGLIKNEKFCLLFNRFIIKQDDDYVSGVYELSPSQGLEVMLNTLSVSSVSTKTVRLTFPEGYTAEQIIAKLDANGVCSAATLRQTIREIDFSSEYSFLPPTTYGSQRYLLLEGYLFPDTYDFYLGESAGSVIRKFLTNFRKQYDEEISAAATARGMTMDQVVTVASILEKEGYGEEQMRQVASVIYNRLGDSASGYAYLGCDSTGAYITDISPEILSEERKSVLVLGYDSYQHAGLPVGPICSPGLSAIKAALDPVDSDWYYFCHDKNRQIYLAETEEQHNKNLSNVLRVNSAGD